MTALYRPQKRDPGRGRLWYATMLVIVLFLLDVFSGGKLRFAVRAAGSTLWEGVAVISRNLSESGMFATKHQLEVENAQLRDALAQYEARDTTYKVLEDENVRLRDLAKIAETAPGVSAVVVSSRVASPYGTFTINAGINAGVSRGDTVVAINGYALGVVSESSAYSALVSEYFAPNAELDVVVGSTAFTLQGSGGGNASGKAPRDSTVHEGDVVRTKSNQEPVGIIGKVVSDASSSYVQVYVRNPTNMLTLANVYVERK